VCSTGHEIICGSLDGSIRNYDIRKGRILKVDFHHPVVSISLSSDKDFLLASCLDNTIRLVNTSTGELFSQYSGHVCQRYTISSCLDPSDSIIVSGSEDNRIYFWDLVNGSMMKQPQPGGVLHSINEHKGIVFCTRFHAESRMMLSTSSDATVKVWSRLKALELMLSHICLQEYHRIRVASFSD
ncbi:WD domain, G-beta repeat-containing protein, partial [Cardiosporidium cionae]